MKTIEVNASKREAVGKKDSKKLRKEGNIPGVLYGGKENIHFFTPMSELRKIIYTPNVYILDLDVNNDKKQAIIKDMQFHPVSDDLLHLDLLEVSEDKPVMIEIPVKLNGLAKGVREGGKLQLMLRRILIKGLLKDLPDVLNIDVNDLELGQSLYIEDVSFENLEILSGARTPIAAVKLTRMAKGLESSATEEAVATEEAES